MKYKKFILALLILLASFTAASGEEISINWTKMQGNTGQYIDEANVIHIAPAEGFLPKDYFAVYKAISGGGKVVNDTVYADADYNISNSVKLGKKMGQNIFSITIFRQSTILRTMNVYATGVSWLEILFGLLGGLGIFLFGMKYMSEGLQKIAGDGLRSIIAKITKNTFFGVLTGFAVTSIIQSSSATTVMVVGFVNAGLMTLLQSIGIIMGSNIGTTMTAQLIAFKLETIALPAIGIGVMFILFSKSSKYRFWGETVFGFGLLFFGMTLMSSTISPIKDSPSIIDFFIRFSHSPILAMLTGLIVTLIVQSSSATVGLTMVLASQGLIDIYAAVPMVFGENIGTTITALLASISSTREGKRAAIIHALFNVIGVSYMMLGLYFVKTAGVPVYLRLIDIITPGRNLLGENSSRFIANAHTVFNVFNTVVFLPFAGVLKFLAEKIIPGKKDEAAPVTKYLDKNLLVTPHIALYQVRREMQNMLLTAKEAIEKATLILLNDRDELIDEVRRLELKTDILQNEITTYIISISKENLTDKEFSQIPVYIHSINDIERIADHSKNIIEFHQTIKDTNTHFSKDAASEITKMNETLQKMMDLTNRQIEEPTDEIREVFIMEDDLNEFEKSYNRNHALRLAEHKCDDNSAALFTDILTSYERCGDHVMNIAQAIYNKFEWRSI